VSLKLSGYVELPPHSKPGGFDHAAVHRANRRLYVAHTANDALDVLDCVTGRYLHSLPNLAEVAGALVSDERNLVFTSNRGENTVGIFTPDDEAGLVKVPVGVRPNGLAFDPGRGLLLAANVGDPAIPTSYTLSIVDSEARAMIASVPAPGRTRWTVFDPQTEAFYVNIAEPAQIVVVAAADPNRIERAWPMPVAGPHGLDLDPDRQRLFCACDARQLLCLELPSSYISARSELAGTPDVIFFNPVLRHLYVAIGDPGLIQVFDTDSLQLVETLLTEKGAHTLAFDSTSNKVYAFLPQTHRVAVYVDQG
jgi:DNA-binding beta-propeller fold protein YncE